MRRVMPLFLLLSGGTLFASTYVVNNLGDGADAIPGDDFCATASSVCTLRAAIAEANAHAGADSITFSVAGTIAPVTSLPVIVGSLTIDGTSAPGYSTSPVVVLAGGGTIPNGLDFATTAPASQLHALKIHGFTNSGIVVGGTGVEITRNHLGPIGGGAPNGNGVILTFNSSGAVIGGNIDGHGNVISGNASAGVFVDGSRLHTIADNLIGVAPAGNAALPNGSGISVSNGNSVRIGGTTSATFNVVSGNSGIGVSIVGGSSITVAGNLIGLDASGAFAVGNGTAGVSVSGNASFVGTPTERNVISGNGQGVTVIGTTTVVNNTIGLNAAGTAAVPNAGAGISAGSGAAIGTPAAGNVISGNSGHGIISGASVIRNNIIGLDPMGMIAFGNLRNGIESGGPNVVIGGTSPNEGNTISANGNDGIAHRGSFGLRVHGNTIGLTGDRTTARPNLGNGIHVDLFASDVRIGSAGGGMNVISANGRNGIAIADSTTVRIEGNRIGTDGSGTSARGNEQLGVLLSRSSGEVRDNLISHNLTGGIRLIGGSSFGVHGNTIASNGLAGIAIVGISTNSIGANSIVANGLLGIDLNDDDVTPNDPQDADTGANGSQNFPILGSARSDSATSLIEGALQSTPNTTFTLRFFSNAAADASGFGEGQQFVGSTDVTTNASGAAAFIWVGPSLGSGQFATATATGPTGTSEFSAVTAVTTLPSIRFSAGLYSVAETQGMATIRVIREGDLTVTSTVDYATAPDTASAVLDYAPATGTLTFLPSESEKTFLIVVLADATAEPEERFRVTLSNPTLASLIVPSTADVAIAADPLPSLSIDDVTQPEGNGGATTFTFTVTLSNPSAIPISVAFATANGSAVTPHDYAARSETLTFAPGVVTQTIAIAIVPDLIDEADETFVVNLANPSNASIADGQGIGTILDDDATIPTVSTLALIALLVTLAALAILKMR